jgi:hypothetical protein
MLTAAKSLRTPTQAVVSVVAIIGAKSASMCSTLTPNANQTPTKEGDADLPALTRDLVSV